MTLRTKWGTREKTKPKKTRRPTKEEKEHCNRRVASKLSHQHSKQQHLTAWLTGGHSVHALPHSSARHHASTPTGRPYATQSHSLSLRRPSRKSTRHPSSRGSPRPHGISYSSAFEPARWETKFWSRTYTSARRQDATKHSGCRKWLKDRLAESEETVDARMKWKWIKRVRSEYKQRPVSLKNHKGKPTSCSKQAQTFAEHLSHQQWAPPQHHYTGSHEPIPHNA